jgi:hypothetical protein
MITLLSNRLFRPGLLSLAACFLAAVPARAGLSVTFNLEIERYQDLTGGYYFYAASPDIGFVNPVPVTTNSVVSPDGQMSGEVWPGYSYQNINPNTEYFSSLDQMIYACTNGQWTLYINRGDPSEQIFHFTVSINGLTTNLFTPINILVPVNNAVNVATNTPFQWSGPANFSSLNVEASQEFPPYAVAGSAFLPVSATNWPSPPVLPYGTNIFYVEYALVGFPNVSFTTPVDAGQNPVSSWSSGAVLYSDISMSFVVGAPAPLPVQLTVSRPQPGGGSFQLGFQTQAGRPETIQVRTNLAAGVWMDVTNFIGNGSIRQFTFPTTNAPWEYFRVVTQ